MKRLLITIPCYKEELILKKTVEIVRQYSKANFSSRFTWKILIIDNASPDRTGEIAKELANTFPAEIAYDTVLTPGRGAALRESWGRHKEYDVYVYMDADLATDLKDFSSLVNKIEEGYDLVTGSRYIPGADVKRSFLRLVLSKCYNLLLHVFLGVSFRDAQCGFKAFSRKLVSELIPVTTDNGWFWDTELMILALRDKKYKVLEIPVSWREVRDELRRSKVSVLTEMIRQLKNISRMRNKLKKQTP